MNLRQAFFCITLSIACAYANAGTITVNLTGYTNDKDLSVRFDCEGDGLRVVQLGTERIPGTGTIKRFQCDLSSASSVIHRDFHLQVLDANGRELQDIIYKFNTVTGGIEGPSLLQQTTRFIDSGVKDQPYVVNFGVSHVAPPIQDQAYIYVGRHRIAWMETLASDYPTTKVRDLVLPGSHDSGMFLLSDPTHVVSQLCNPIVFPPLINICKFAHFVDVNPVAQSVINLGLTQKDTTMNQLKTGTRFFDFRPAKPKGGSTAYHVHNFIPGAQFNHFLQDINSFLTSYRKEIVFVQITGSGVNDDYFEELTEKEVETYLRSNVSMQDIGYTLVKDIREISSRTLRELATSGPRLIAIYGKNQVNDSYSDVYSTYYSAPIIVAIYNTLGLCQNTGDQYTILQLQATASSYVVDKWATLAANHGLSWINNLFLSETGSILQATKGWLDAATYPYLVEHTMLGYAEKCRTPIVILNDFVDVALTAHAYSLTKYRASRSLGDESAAVASLPSDSE